MFLKHIRVCKYLLLVFNDTKKPKNGTVKIKNTEVKVTLQSWDVAVYSDLTFTE